MAQKKTTRKSSSLKQGKVADMRFLIVVRHGAYDDDFNLNHRGKDQIQRLSEKLKDFVNGNKILLLSSPAPRASQSAKIISEKLNVPFEEHEILWSDNDHWEDYDGLLKIVKKRRSKAEIIILVTHLEYVEGFPDHFARNELAMDIDYPPIPSKGEACLVDCINKCFQLISCY
ncbi:MAG: histidine phosphatase family protein [Candidatus Moraniibacteriota bacterium]